MRQGQGTGEETGAGDRRWDRPWTGPGDETGPWGRRWDRKQELSTCTPPPQHGKEKAQPGLPGDLLQQGYQLLHPSKQGVEQEHRWISWHLGNPGSPGNMWRCRQGGFLGAWKTQVSLSLEWQTYKHSISPWFARINNFPYCRVSFTNNQTSQELRIAALRVVGCQSVNVFLLKDVIITTSVTTVIFITITIYYCHCHYCHCHYCHKKNLVTKIFFITKKKFQSQKFFFSHNFFFSHKNLFSHKIFFLVTKFFF